MRFLKITSTILVALALGTAGQTLGQSLNSINFSYWYDVNNEIEFVMNPVVRGQKVLVFYQLTANRKEYPITVYSIDWQSREDLNDRDGKTVPGKDSVLQQTDQLRSGIFTFPVTDKKWLLVAKVTNSSIANPFFFYKPIDSQWPVNELILTGGAPSNKRYVPINSTVKFSASGKLYGFLYKKSFSAALPPFAESKPTDPFLRADSSFSFVGEFIPRSTGLYLVQEDTTSARGVTVLVTEASYPRYSRIALLAEPLVYISTDDEYLRLSAANTDKAAFDRVILEITNDKERAKNLMRSYFQRVEIANRFFTDYKEGWRTDRGMLYIIYGKPDEVSRTATTETWYYESRKTKFEFRKTGSIFNPENYKLDRDNKYMPEWFSMVDLWRKSRF